MEFLNRYVTVTSDRYKNSVFYCMWRFSDFSLEWGSRGPEFESRHSDQKRGLQCKSLF